MASTSSNWPNVHWPCSLWKRPLKVFPSLEFKQRHWDFPVGRGWKMVNLLLLKIFGKHCLTKNTRSQLNSRWPEFQLAIFLRGDCGDYWRSIWWGGTERSKWMANMKRSCARCEKHLNLVHVTAKATRNGTCEQTVYNSYLIIFNMATLKLTTNILKTGDPKRKGSSSNHQFSGAICWFQGG